MAKTRHSNKDQVSSETVAGETVASETVAGERQGDDTRAEAKLTVRVGGGEVHLEGRQEVVREELGRVLDRLFDAAPATPARSETAGSQSDDSVVVSVAAPRQSSPASLAPASAAAASAFEVSRSTASQTPEATASALEFVTHSRGRQAMDPGAADLLRHVRLDPATLGDLFSADPQGRVSLLVAPRTAGQKIPDLLMLLLYGLLTLRGVSSSNGTALLRGVRSLGYRIERVPRKFGVDDDRIHPYGRHRTKRYRLTAAGIRHCEALITRLIQDFQG